MNYILDTANVFVDTYRNRFEVITTPSAIWLKRGNRIREVYPLHSKDFEANYDFLPDETQAVISPSGKEILFYFDSKIIKVHLKSSRRTILGNGNNSSPQWSYRGDLIGFMDEREFETKTSLWVMRTDGTRKHCLVKHQFGEKSLNTVKSFRWHPSRNLIIFVEGYTWGTVTFGGNIYGVDMQGNRKTLVVANSKMEEISSDIYISNDSLIYQIVHFKNNYMDTTLTTHKVPLSDLIKE